MVSLSTGLRSVRAKRAVAGAAIVLATGGLVLARASSASPHSGGFGLPETTGGLTVAGGAMTGTNAAGFAGPGVHGQVALSHTKVLAGSGTSVLAEVRLAADKTDGAKERAPLSMVVVLDTSGSMEGEKIDRAKDSVLGLMRDMRDDDEIAFVRYASDAELIQPLARMSAVRGSLTARVRRLEAGGGTNIPSGLSLGLRTLSEAEQGRVRRVVLVSDGLDSTRAEAERLASDSAERGITVSSMGIGLDFDEAYMSSLARDGHGNFAFVNDGAGLATFLHRELDEASSTTVENATVRLTLPKGVRFVRANGADARVEGNAVVVKMGSLFGGDERRALLELTTSLGADDVQQIATEALWHRVGAGNADVHAPDLSLTATLDPSEVQRGKDGAVIASWTSVASSQRELEAAQAYAHGDQATADSLVQQNLQALASAAVDAPAPMAASLERQAAAYASQRKTFAAAAPASDDGKRAAKSAAAKETSNLGRSAY
jgi:Ca-activated chloride channel family protein